MVTGRKRFANLVRKIDCMQINRENRCKMPGKSALNRAVGYGMDFAMKIKC